MRYNNICTVGINVNIKPDWIVTALAQYNYDSDDYKATFYLNRKDIDRLDLISDRENVKVEANKRTIKTALLNIIEKDYNAGFYNNYINIYDELVEATDLGIEIMESKRSGDAND